MKNITIGSLFDGIGAFPYAASIFGIKTLWASEILPHAISVTRRHFPDMTHVGDITKLSGESLPPVDVISRCRSYNLTLFLSPVGSAASHLFGF
jgi:DNA (cytosine-5)-methyltransferase 1